MNKIKPDKDKMYEHSKKTFFKDYSYLTYPIINPF